MDEQMTVIPIDSTTKAELRAHLFSRIDYRLSITPTVLLRQLQNGSIDSVEVISKILEFPIDQIRIALSNLAAKGLE